MAEGPEQRCVLMCHGGHVLTSCTSGCCQVVNELDVKYHETVASLTANYSSTRLDLNTVDRNINDVLIESVAPRTKQMPIIIRPIDKLTKCQNLICNNTREFTSVWNECVKIASKGMWSRNNDELSSWSCVSIISMAFPAETTHYLNTKSNTDLNPNTNSLFRYCIPLLASFVFPCETADDFSAHAFVNLNNREITFMNILM